MIIGIDVGGTFTDAVVLDKGSGEIRQSVKVPTLHDNLPGSLEQALKAVLKDVEPGKITRVTLSTTIVTNLIAERKFSPVGLLIIPGPGLKPDYISFAATTIVLTGAIDHRGRVTMPVDPREVRAAVKQFKVAGINQVAVVSKFSVRNNTLEEQTASLIRQEAPDLQVELGHMCGGQLNFPRRIVNTVLTMATKARYQEFVSAVKVALATLTIKAEVMILKADGGTLPLEQSLNTPVETVFSGPAASVLGALALTNATTTGVVVDIGGTTTDLALILSGKPLMASKGVAVDEQLTQVRSFAIRALPIGGDSEIAVQDSRLIIKPYRSGRAACLGGPSPTPTDALRILGKVQLGSLELAQKALQPVADLLGLSLKECAENVVNEAANIIYKGIVSMYLSWQR
ncbi:MAG TPA: hydantoinase/oxoprolinase family protein, partial [Bacillota bacterium]|nr:hydantoinase/oxoprolinase family protein [Bacillota bacterium]